MNTPRQRRLVKAERKKMLISLLGGKCTNCGVTKKLHFDHIKPETKHFDISQRLEGKWDKLLEEVKKCQLLCSSCHGKKTRAENPESGVLGKRWARLIHGTASGYTNHRCRCTACREANTSALSAYRLSLRTRA